MGEYYNDFRSCQTIDDLKLKLNRFFESFFSEIDSLNVVSLNTNMTRISSADGTTLFNGALLNMYDPSNVQRLSMGNNGSDYQFNLYNKAGLATLTLDATTGDIKMNSGAITWANVNSDPLATTANSTANSALTTAQQIANGTYTGGTFISGTTVYSPAIYGGTITGGTLTNSGTYTHTYINSTGITFKDSSDVTKLQLYVEFDNNPNMKFTNNTGGYDTLFTTNTYFGLSGTLPFVISPVTTISNTLSVTSTLTASSIVTSDISYTGDVNINPSSSGTLYLSTLGSRNIVLGSSALGKLSFFGATPIYQKTATYGSMTTSGTADGTYSSNEQTMLNDLKTDVSNLWSKVNGILGIFSQTNYNLITVT